MAIQEYSVMTPELRKQFLEKGWVKIEGAISLENIKSFSDDVWIRLGFDPNDKTTWEKEKIHMPRHREVPMKQFSPKGWAAICEILGGEERIDTTLFGSFGDSLICNLGSPEWENKESIDPRLLGNWHIDGDWYTCGTYLSPDGIKNVVKWLYEHPEGADSWPRDESGSSTVCNIHQCQEFIELTGKAGDVIIFHPLMPHSASKNYLRIPRFITNPPVTLKAPLNLNREDPQEYSLTELVILRALEEISVGKSAVKDWKITRKRRRFTPRTRAGKDVMINAEVERMKSYALKSGGAYKVNSMHINGPVPYQTVIPIEY
ncbi:hypothetical protein PNOK_0842400 [Pyrrhoderma noxium]|uniref:Clavaminate synthase n=1 Tax=Pyrrhoderma noxium TaxID=2282107 RepID=A0A286U7L6_9AGAM|nr:hypothetical protein PNOK_0842400 [Pyrrhoderma noxium]